MANLNPDTTICEVADETPRRSSLAIVRRSGTQFSRLNDDVYFAIIEHLDNISRYAMMQTCRLLYHFVITISSRNVDEGWWSFTAQAVISTDQGPTHITQLYFKVCRGMLGRAPVPSILDDVQNHIVRLLCVSLALAGLALAGVTLVTRNVTL